MSRKAWLLLFFIVVAMGAIIWASDRVTLEGERTVYTANCAGGAWQGLVCSGRLEAGARYRFRASKSRGEVHHWIAGSAERSGKMTDCTVRNRGNWSCKTPDSTTPAIAQSMVADRLVPDRGAPAATFHAVAKWKWWVLRWGIPGVLRADY